MKPFVSVVTPTKNRPEFIPNILRNFIRQDYSMERMELLIADDSDISYENIYPKKDNIKYYYVENMNIGTKRNFLCDKCKGDIIVFMDDDDYYPNDKVSNVVDNLWESKYQVSGSSIMHIYYICYDKIFRYGPYNLKNNKTNHTTCGTMSIKKDYFKNNKFPNKEKSEEKDFLRDWKTEVLQLDSFKSILCISHLDNTVDKHKYIKTGVKTDILLTDIVVNKIDIEFYKNLLNKQSGGEFKIIEI